MVYLFLDGQGIRDRMTGAAQDMQREARDWLLAYCRKGEQPAFSRFYRRHSPGLWRFLVPRGATVDGASDPGSHVFTRFGRVVC